MRFGWVAMRWLWLAERSRRSGVAFPIVNSAFTFIDYSAESLGAVLFLVLGCAVARP